MKPSRQRSEIKKNNSASQENVNQETRPRAYSNSLRSKNEVKNEEKK